MHFVIGNGNSLTFEQIQAHNLKALGGSIKEGYSQFCDSDIDQGILSFHGGGDPQDCSVELISHSTNVTLPLRDIHKVFKRDLDFAKKTIIFINGFFSTERNLIQNIRNIAKCSNLHDVLILNFARSLQMLYNTAMHNIPVFAYAVLRILDTLVQNKLSKHQIVLVGHSQGAHIASAAAKLFHQQHAWRLPLVIALDPAIPCDPKRQYVNREVAEQVLVIHTDHKQFGLKDAMGTIDYYPNGVDKQQPGCKDPTCSHEKAVQIFAESVCNPGSFMAVRCKDWDAFQKNMCYRGGVVPIGLRIPPGTKGKYYSMTKREAPFGLGFSGISPNKVKSWWNHDI
ncbi:phospholipase A1 1 [Hermetia illucens]|nr:phospholipase A1 1 [Hermetia illucens]